LLAQVRLCGPTCTNAASCSGCSTAQHSTFAVAWDAHFIEAIEAGV
jgi:hypothetical protein